jgi:DNA replication protein DnaC
MKSNLNEDFQVKCQICNDTGWVHKGNLVYRCQCRLVEITDSISQRMKIPRRYKDKSLENFEVNEKYGHDLVIKKIMNYITSPSYKKGKGLILIGPPGVGKTHLAVGILKEFFLKRRIVGLFRDTKSLLFDLRATFDGSSSTREMLEEVLETPILVLDDLGSERLSDWARDILHYIIIQRYNELRPIIITTNLELEADIELSKNDSLEERMGKPIMSRISEICEPIYVAGEDKRGKTQSSLKEIKEEEQI